MNKLRHILIFFPIVVLYSIDINNLLKRRDAQTKTPYVIVIPIYGPSNQIVCSLNSLAIAMEFSYLNAKALFFPMYPHYLQVFKRKNKNCLGHIELSMIPSDYVNPNEYVLDIKQNNIIKFEPQSLVLCSSITRNELLTHSHAIRALKDLNDSLSYPTNDYEGLFRNGAIFKYIHNDRHGIVNCTKNELNNGKNVIVLSHSHDICAHRFHIPNIIKNDHITSQKVYIQSLYCPYFPKILSISQSLFTNKVFSFGYTLGYSWEQWLKEAISIHIRVQDIHTSTQIWPNTSFYDTIFNIRSYCSSNASRIVLTKTFDDFRSRVMKRLLLLADHPKLFILSNNKWMKRLFRSYKLADGRYCMEWFSISYLFYIYYCS